MARRIYLHVGVMKSATSYLQALCEHNWDRLASAGIYWCRDDLRYEAVRDLLAKAGRASDGMPSWDQLDAALRAHTGDALLSNELLAGLGGRQVRRLATALPEAELRVVITARELSRTIPSHWQTTVKNGRSWTWAEFASAVCSDGPQQPESVGGSAADEETLTARHPDINAWFWRRHDLAAIATRWADVVPVERITLVTVPATSRDPGVVAARVGSVVGIDVTVLEPPDATHNPALGAHSAELLRRLNRSASWGELADPEHRYERALGGALAAQAELEPPFGLTQSQQDWVSERARAMVEEVRLLGVRVVGQLGDLIPATTAAPDTVDPADTTESQLLAAAARGLVALAPVFNDLRAERDALRRRLR